MKLSTGVLKIDWVLSNMIYWTIAAVGLLLPSKIALGVFACLTLTFVIVWGFIFGVKWMCKELDFAPSNAEDLDLDYALPKWLVHGSDIALAAILLFSGHWVLTLLILTQTVLEYRARLIKLRSCSSAE